MTERAAQRPSDHDDQYTENYARRFELIVKLLAAAQAQDDDRYAQAYDELVKFEKVTGSFDWRVCLTCLVCEMDDRFGDRTWATEEMCSVCANG